MSPQQCFNKSLITQIQRIIQAGMDLFQVSSSTTHSKQSHHQILIRLLTPYPGEFWVSLRMEAPQPN